MEFNAVYHQASDNYCYPLNEDELIINIKTGYDVKSVSIILGDPFAAGILGGGEHWDGKKEPIIYKKRLKNQIWWTTTVRPEYKRLKYYFELQTEEESWFYFEDGFVSSEQMHLEGRSRQCFVFPWMNPCDVPRTPAWVNDTVWYQIFPDRFCNGDPSNDPENVVLWREHGSVTNEECFGGDLAGITDKLDYLQNLGINGLYLTPINEAPSNHKYDTTDYTKIDPRFGDEETFKQTEERLDRIRSLMAKYGNSEEAVLKSLEEKRERLQELENYEELAALASRELEAQTRSMEQLCGTLSEARKRAARVLEERIGAELMDLNFLHVDFRIDVRDLEHFTAQGADEVEFMISTNPGSVPPRPLGEVASGGELSRIMLAIKTVLADTDDIPTLIFDEIDTGISGRTAQKVSERLSYIAGKHQVLCITHLPQIAAMADTHFEIRKTVENGKTSTRIHKLGKEEQTEELARLLGGAEITGAVLENAREMKRLAEKKKRELLEERNVI